MRMHEDLKAWVDGELPPSDAARMSELVASDPDLQSEAAFLRALSSEIKNLAVQPQPEGAEQLLRELRREPLTWAQKLRPIRWHIAGLAGVSAVFLGLVIGLSPLSRSVGVEVLGKEMVSAASPVSNSPASDFAEVDQAPQRSANLEAKGMTPPFPGSQERMDYDGGRKNSLSPEYRRESRDILNKAQKGASTQPGGGVSTEDAHRILSPKLKRDGNLGVEVRNADEARLNAEKTIKLSDGLVLNSQTTSGPDRTSVNIEARVPEVKFEETMRSLRSLGHVIRESTTGQDLTAEVVDSRSNVEVLADQEQALQHELDKARTERGRAAIRSQIYDIRRQLQSWKAQAKALDQMTTYSTIQLELVQSQSGGLFGSSQGPLDTWTEAANGMGGVMAAFTRVLIYVVVFAPVWLPLVIMGFMIRKRMRA